MGGGSVSMRFPKGPDSFVFDIQILRNLAASGVGVREELGVPPPPTGNPRSATGIDKNR